MVLITPLRMGPIQRYRHFLYIINEKQPTFKYAIEGWLFFSVSFNYLIRPSFLRRLINLFQPSERLSAFCFVFSKFQ